jgi:hypothetical protein
MQRSIASDRSLIWILPQGTHRGDFNQQGQPIPSPLQARLDPERRKFFEPLVAAYRKNDHPDGIPRTLDVATSGT